MKEKAIYNLISAFCVLVFLSASITSCNKALEGSSIEAAVESSDFRTKVRLKVYAAWTMKGNDPMCDDGSVCGTCPSVCFKIKWEREKEHAIGPGTGEVELLNPDQLLLIHTNSSIDDGTGAVNVTDPFDIGQSVPAEYGLQNITILPGVYPIDYTEGGNGKVIFNVMTN